MGSEMCIRDREWTSICGHTGSLTHLMTVKPYLEFSSFCDALPLVVPIVVVLLLKRMMSLEASEVT